MAQLSPIHSWKLIFPCEVSAVKLGASSLMRNMVWSPDLSVSKRGCVREIIPKRSIKVESVGPKPCQFLANFECEKKKLTQRRRGRKGAQRFRELVSAPLPLG